MRQTQPTVGELAAALATIVTIGPYSTAWGLFPWAAILGGSVYLLRRSDSFRQWVEQKLVELEEDRSPYVYQRALAQLPVPPSVVNEPPRLIDERPKLPPQRSGTTDRLTLMRVAAGLEPVEVAAPAQEEEVFNARISVEQLVELLVNESDDYPHVLIIGSSGSGKSTLAQYIASALGGHLVILDKKRPKGWERTPKWGGLPYVSLDKRGSYKPMIAALQKVVNEMDRRYREQDTAKAPFAPITVILDEAKNTVAECPRIAELYRSIVSIGREVGIRLVLISTTDRARQLGFGGEADSLDSFLPIRTGRFALTKDPDVRQFGTHMYDYALAFVSGEWVSIDTAVARKPFTKSRVWSPVQYNCQTAAEDPLLEQLLTQQLSSISVGAEFRKVPESLTETPSISRQLPALSGGEESNFGDPKNGLENHLKVFAAASLENRKLVLKALEIFYTNGRKKTAAICAAAGIQPGSKYQELSPIFDAALAIKERKRA